MYKVLGKGGTQVSLGNNVNEINANLASLGISIDSSGNITFNRTMFKSSLEYGLYIEGSATIYLNENTINSISANTDSNATADCYGIYCDSTLTIKGEGELIVSGATSAIYVSNSMKFTDGTYTDMMVLQASTDCNGTGAEKEPNITVWKPCPYKYVNIGSVLNCYMKYNVSEGVMYKVSSDGRSQESIHNNELVYGWSIVNKNLILDDFILTTRLPKALVIDGKTTVYVYDECSIKSMYNSDISYSGLETTNDVTFFGDGNITIENISNSTNVTNNFTALSSTGDISLNGGTYTLTGGIGIKATRKLEIYNTSVLCKGITGAVNIGASNIHGNVMVDNNYDGTGVSQNTAINHTELGVVNTYKYIKIEPSIISVEITWGDMNYLAGKSWNPINHSYYYDLRPANEESGLIKVSNTTDSNVPIMAKCDYNAENSYADITGKLQSTTDEFDDRGYKVDNGYEMIGTLDLTVQNNREYDFVNQTEVGNVCLILAEY